METDREKIKEIEQIEKKTKKKRNEPNQKVNKNGFIIFQD